MESYLLDTNVLLRSYNVADPLHTETTDADSTPQNHDARIAAAMITHSVPNLLTLNPTDFQRYAGINVLTPADVLAQAQPSAE